ncbi:hypothetical protein BW721_04765 [Jeotgalibaca sp. PTS2502]|nr:hypothetical protein BW721_04765 [Jeotgalibaca sp. PTS2502]
MIISMPAYPMTPHPNDVLAEHTVDFISFSYYMSTTATSEPEKYQQTKGNILGGIPNPYLEASEWGVAGRPCLTESCFK